MKYTRKHRKTKMKETILNIVKSAKKEKKYTIKKFKKQFE